MMKRTFLRIVMVAALSCLCLAQLSAQEDKQDAKGTSSFAVVGDVQVKGHSSKWLKAAKWIAERKPEFWFPMGDLVDEGLKPDQWEAFREGEKIISPVSKVLPVLGNHDHYTKSPEKKNIESMPGLYLENFSVPENGPEELLKRCYYVKTKNCLFVVLDTNCFIEGGNPKKLLSGVETPWLRKVLSENKARWTFVFTHAPLYSSGRHGTESEWLRKEWCHLFDEFGVDAVFSGHTHAFEVTKPIRNGVVAENGKGTVYYNSGGITFSDVAKGDWYTDFLQKEDRKLMIGIVELKDNSAAITTWDIDSGTAINTVSLKKD